MRKYNQAELEQIGTYEYDMLGTDCGYIILLYVRLYVNVCDKIACSRILLFAEHDADENRQESKRRMEDVQSSLRDVNAQLFAVEKGRRDARRRWNNTRRM